MKAKRLRLGALGAMVAVAATGELTGFLFSFSFLKVFSLKVFFAMQEDKGIYKYANSNVRKCWLIYLGTRIFF
jgi:hypothetical protein